MLSSVIMIMLLCALCFGSIAMSISIISATIMAWSAMT